MTAYESASGGEFGSDPYQHDRRARVFRRRHGLGICRRLADDRDRDRGRAARGDAVVARELEVVGPEVSARLACKSNSEPVPESVPCVGCVLTANVSGSAGEFGSLPVSVIDSAVFSRCRDRLPVGRRRAHDRDRNRRRAAVLHSVAVGELEAVRAN